MFGSSISGASAASPTRALVPAVNPDGAQPAPMPPSATDHLSTLPNELFSMVVSHLPAKDVLSLGQTGSSIRQKMTHELACMSVTQKADTANSIEKLQSALSRFKELPVEEIPKSLLVKPMTATGRAFTPLLDWATRMDDDLPQKPSPAFMRVFDELIQLGQTVGGTAAAQMFKAMANPLPWFGFDEVSTLKCARQLIAVIGELPSSLQVEPLVAAARSIARRPLRDVEAAVVEVLGVVGRLPLPLRAKTLAGVEKELSALRQPRLRKAAEDLLTAFKAGGALEDLSDNEGSVASATSCHSDQMASIKYDPARKPQSEFQETPPVDISSASPPRQPTAAPARRSIAVPIRQLYPFNHDVIATGEKLNALVDIQKRLLAWNDGNALASVPERDLAAMVRDLKYTFRDQRATNVSLKLNQIFLNLLATAVASDDTGNMVETAGRLLRSPDRGTRKIGKEHGYYRTLLASPELVPSLKSLVSACESHRISEVETAIGKIGKKLHKQENALLKHGEAMPTVPPLSPDTLHDELSRLADDLFRAADDLIEQDQAYTQQREEWARMDETNRQREHEVLESDEAKRIVSKAMDSARDRVNGEINERHACELIRKQLSDKLGVSSYGVDQHIDHIVETQTIKEATATLVRQRAVDRMHQAREEEARARRAAEDDAKREIQNAQSRAYEQLQQQKGKSMGAALINAIAAGLDNVTNSATNALQLVPASSEATAMPGGSYSVQSGAFESLVFPAIPTHDPDTASITTTASDLDRSARLETLRLDARLLDLTRAINAHELRAQATTSEMAGMQYFTDDGKPATFYSGS